MRVAALDLPDLVLQLRLRDRGWRPDALVAVTTPEAGRDVVVAATPPAREAGVHPGQPASHAQARVAGLTLLPADFAAAFATLTGLAEALFTLSPAVELAPAEALLLDATAATFVPAAEPAPPTAWGRQQHQELAWAEAVLQVVRDFGLTGRVAVADSPETARLVAGALEQPVRAVPPGPPGAAISGIPWALVRHLTESARRQRSGVAEAFAELLPEFSPATFELLDALGLRRLGALRTLPLPTIVERLGSEGERLWRLAGGGRPRALVGYEPPPELAETVAFEPGLEDATALLFALRPAAERVCGRLSGRGLAASRLLLTLETEAPSDGPSQTPPAASAAHLPPPRRRREELPLVFARPTTQARLVVDVLRERLSAWQVAAPVLAVTLSVAETAQRRDQLALGERPHVTEGLESVLARLRSRLGDDAVGRITVRPEHVPERTTAGEAFRPDPPPLRPTEEVEDARADERSAPDPDGPFDDFAFPLRQQPAEEIALERDRSGAVRGFTCRGVHHRVLASTAAERLSTHWWDGAVVRDYQTLLLGDGARVWVFQDPRGAWWLQGWHD